ncbi:type VI secretion system tip protein VgrG [Paraburkholderia sp. Ac-20340]|uniref:type VI secretion system Vgr family protein n=1 Tax=Paraburkholderia sp. Ac-20340 TaxID=2703888 RepID=UPI00197E8CA0|nr:type VI secretion system Vgr family protein [Paraburkholderia sp. Ac-20340]MBN3856619.1 type VI secretion system tip protein VgrG [Paraburkholderia sp. Ac-20340]
MSVITELASFFNAFNRLYSLEGEGALAAMQIERWYGHEALSANFEWDVHTLATNPSLDLEAMLGQRALIRTTLADGSSAVRSGLVAQAECLGFDAGVARYRLQLVPWLAVLEHARDQRTFMKQTVADVLDAVFAPYADIASWRFTADADRRIETLGASPFRVQYRTHTHYAFVRHLLAEAGLGFCFIEDDEAPAGHTMLIFDDSTQLAEDETSARLGGVPRQLSGMNTSADDMIVGIGQSLSLTADRVTLISSDYRANQAKTASASLRRADGARELYDDVGPEAFDSLREAQETAQRHAQAMLSQAQIWTGIGTLRTARAGCAMKMASASWLTSQSDAQAPEALLLTRIDHIGINNLPEAVLSALEQHAAALPATGLDARLLKQAKAGGYANRFDAVPRTQVWRPTLADGTGQRLNPAATALGAQTAIVVGPQGEAQAGATGPVHTDAQGRLRLRFHWQEVGDTGTYPVRAVQRLASEGHGLQQTPRIGHEVLVQFHHGLIHRPIVLGGLFNGRGEGGVMPTPGGTAAQTLDDSVYTRASDHAPSAQANLAGGLSPAWHGAGGSASRQGGGHNHAGALSGFKSQGFDGQGHNQLVADDSDGMGRMQMSTSHAATQLNIGHLRHQADNYLGSFRGQGVELRSDAYGAVRATRGVLVSSYAPAGAAQPAGDVSALQGLLARQIALVKRFDSAAAAHGTLPFAAQRGVTQSGQSALNASAAPLDALAQSFATTVSANGYQQASADASQRATGETLPHSGDAVLGVEAQGGHGMIAGQALQWNAGETLTVGSGGDFNLAGARQLRVHSGQGIGWLAGAGNASGVGMSVIAGKDGMSLQAQQDTLAMRARDDVRLASASADVQIAAKKTVHLAVSGGAHITIEGGNVTFGCPGKFVVYAAQHAFVGPEQADTPLPQFPEKVCVECLMHAMQSGSALAAKAV